MDKLPAKRQEGGFLLRILPAVLVVVLAVIVTLIILTYRLMHPSAVPETVSPSQYLMPLTDAAWISAEGKPIAGWWVPGRTKASAIILVPGFGMSRADLISLAVTLWQTGFSVLAYDLRASGAAPHEASTFGLRETDDLLTALDYLKSRLPSNASQVGIWGADVGARAALRAAVSRPEVSAIVADSVFEFTDDFIRLRLYEDLGVRNREIGSACTAMFRLYRQAYHLTADEKFSLGALAGRSVLLIQGVNRPELAACTAEIYGRLPPGKQILKLPVARMRNMTSEEVRSYDRQVAEFFSANLP
jgi:hypothetical protein